MRRWLKILLHLVPVLFAGAVQASWVETTEVKTREETTEIGGPRIVIEYRITDQEISADQPAYVFIRCSRDSGATWNLLPPENFLGNGCGIVTGPGKKTCYLWGTDQTGLAGRDKLIFKVRAIKMVRVPGGEFKMKSLLGGGYDNAWTDVRVTWVDSFYLAKYETTVAIYADYLNEAGPDGTGWHKRMTDDKRCGIIQTGEPGSYSYSVVPGRENYPATYVSWYDARAFLQWCGLSLPIEQQWEKAVRGGTYLDGDNTKQNPNPLPDRKYPWGDQPPGDGGVFRCNSDGEADGFSHTAPVGSFAEYVSPYGACDLAGNLAEWTRNWYATTYHVDLDGYRILRGGSWMALPVACDAITGATKDPIKESAIVGFRGVLE
ncbi:formylglycine-generating enzyme family protein [Gemmatimonadota bacterium]